MTLHYHDRRGIRLATAVLLFLALATTQSRLCAEEALLHYPVQPGDNPWNITARFLHGMEYWQPLLRRNGIDKPRRLKPGTTLAIPLQWLRSVAANAQVREVSGAAHFVPSGAEQPQLLRPGTKLGAGDRVRIGDPGSALLEYSDGSTLLLTGNTRLTLTHMQRFPGTGLADTRVKLDAGRTENHIKRRGSRFEIETPSASTAVRGTRFRTSVDGQSAEISRVEVTAGNVAVTGSGARRGIGAGFGTLVEKGRPPLPPVRLLPPPRFTAPGAYSRRFPVEIAWAPTTGAQAYRVLVNAAGSEVPLLDQVIQRTGLSTNTLQDGGYRVTLRAIDANGLEGEGAILDFELDAQPQPPIAISPEIEQTVRTELPNFEWTRPGNDSRVHLQLTANADSTAPLLDLAGLDATRFTPERLAPGTYFWRLATQLGDEQGPWSAYRKFVLRPVPGEPEVTSGGDARQIKLRWPDSGEGRRYRVQLGDSAEFDTPLVDETLDTPVWETERPQMPSYFRVRVIDTDGYEGSWSTPQMIDPAPRPWYIYAAPFVFLLLAL